MRSTFHWESYVGFNAKNTLKLILLLRKVAAALKSALRNLEFRFSLILDEFGLSPDSYPAGISSFVRDSTLEPRFRAALIFLAVRARYPNASQIQTVVALIEAGEFDKAIAKLQRSASIRDGSRLLVPSGETLVDVTRFSRTSEMSGIPRVVRHLITSTPFTSASYGVWSDQVFGPVKIISPGIVYFHKSVWGNTRGSHYLYFLLRKFYFAKSVSIAQNKIVARILKLMNRLMFGRFLLKMVDFQAPRVCFIIRPQHLVIPEVPDASNSELLRVWLDSVNLGDSRCIVHDLLPLTHPHFFPKHAFAEHEEYLKLLHSCSTLIVGTPVLADELRERLELDRSNSIIKVLPLPVNLKASPESAAESTIPRLTFIGGYQARKRLKSLVDFLDSCDKSKIHFKVSVVGTPNLLSGHEEERLLERILKQPDIYEIHPALNDSELANLIKASSAVVYISSAEGYGLPVLEALTLGVPVIALETLVNIHFAAEYGGIHLLSETLAPQDLDSLNEIAERGPLWNSLRSSIMINKLPNDVEKWAKTVLSI